MDWFMSIVRICGASFPVSSSLVQLQAEIDAKAFNERLIKLEDPISQLHLDVQTVSKLLYEALLSANSQHFHLEPSQYEEFGKPLALLESHGFLKGEHSISTRYYAGIRLLDPSYIMYVCKLFADNQAMEALVNRVESCPKREWIQGDVIARELNLPLPVVEACFDIFESMGYGLCAKELGPSAARYMGKV